MALQKYGKGSVPIQEGQPLTHFYIVAGGNLEAVCSGFSFSLKKGDVIGLTDLAFDTHSCTYTVTQDAALIPYPCQSPEQLAEFFKNAPDMGPLILSSATRLITEITDHFVLLQYNCGNFYEDILQKYEEYKQLCVRFSISPKNLPGMEDLEPLALEEDVPSWLSSYYDAVRSLVSGAKTLFLKEPWMAAGFLLKASQDMHAVLDVCRRMNDYMTDSSYLLLNENRLDFFDLFTELYFRIFRAGEDIIPLGALLSRLFIQIESNVSIDRSLYQQRLTEYKTKVQMLEQSPQEALPDSSLRKNTVLANSLNTILAYGDCSGELSEQFIGLLLQYKALLDKNSQDDHARALRLNLTKVFYEVYKNVFLISLNDEELPPVIRMFLNFGYVDEELAGYENAAYLYSIADQFCADPSHGVYTIYEWLIMIYKGKKTPSRNEFDTDYEGYLREQRVSGKITPQVEQHMLGDSAQKVLFELNNMFPLVNKITFGRITSFCPVLSEHNVLKELNAALVTPDKVQNCLDQIRSLDYSAYYRESIYSNPECGVPREYIDMEVLPDVILMPNIGTRGVMWQEIEGRRRNTPARMMVPVFTLENLMSLLTRLTGEYRWEMCKRIQGARWNDVSDPSLTSEYFDYAQFYRKNHELSTDAKEKIKTALQKAKNNFKEFFVQDYITWILYEGNGSPRLNKAARTILFSYCPFSKPVRTQLRANPLYKEMLDRYDIKANQKLHHMEILFQKITKSGTEVPPELLAQQQYLMQ